MDFNTEKVFLKGVMENENVVQSSRDSSDQDDRADGSGDDWNECGYRPGGLAHGGERFGAGRRVEPADQRGRFAGIESLRLELPGQFVTVALLVESVWESMKMVWQNGKFSLDTLGALLLGMAVCMLAHVDLFAIAGINMGAPIAGELLTGALVSRGSNFVHDLISKVNESRVK